MKKMLLFIAFALVGVLAFATLKWFNNAELKKEQKPVSIQTTQLEEAVVPSQFTQSESGFNLRFLDEGTGIAIIPDNVEIKKNGEEKNLLLITKEKITPNGTTSILLPNGSYDIRVNAQGYELMSSFFQLDNQVLDVNFNLVPLNPSKELSSSYIQSFHRPDAMVIVGFIVDDVTGKPIDKVEIHSADKKGKTLSKANGFFQLTLPLAENENVLDDRGTLFFLKQNYTTEVRQNFDMWSNGDIILQLRMKIGSGQNKEDIIKTRKANRETRN